MTRFSSTASLALAVVVVLGIAGPVAAGEQVPFQGTYEGSFTSTRIAGTPNTLVVTAGTGQATQLGHFSFDSTLIANVVLLTGSGTVTFTAANGDQVFADIITLSTPLPTGRLIEEIGIITGGTGRFAGATGSFIGERLLNRATGEVIGFFDGTISSPGAGN